MPVDAAREVRGFRERGEQRLSRTRSAGRPPLEEVKVAEQLQRLDGRGVEGQLEIDISNALADESR